MALALGERASSTPVRCPCRGPSTSYGRSVLQSHPRPLRSFEPMPHLSDPPRPRHAPPARGEHTALIVEIPGRDIACFDGYLATPVHGASWGSFKATSR